MCAHSRQEIVAVVREVMQLVLEVAVPTDCDLDREATPGWDSLTQVSMLFTIEQELQVRFTTQEIASAASGADLVAAACAASLREFGAP